MLCIRYVPYLRYLLCTYHHHACTCSHTSVRSAICHRSSAICQPPSANPHLPSAISLSIGGSTPYSIHAMPCTASHRTAPHRTAHRFHPAPLASQVHRQVASRRAECLRHGHIPSQRCQPAVPVQCPCGGCPGRIRKAGRVKQG